MATISPSELEYQKSHINDSRVPEIIAAFAVCLPLAYIAVILRFTSRRIGKIALKADDYWVIIALLFTSGFVICEIYTTHLGLGRHVILLKHPKTFAKLILAKEIVYNPAIVALKTSILLLYRRIFTEKGINSAFNVTLWCTGMFVLTYSIVQIFLTIFQCSPVNAVWDPMIPGHCIKFSNALIIFSCLNIATDVLMLALPIPQLWKLNMPIRRKVQLMGIFLLGGFVCIASIVRVPYIADISLTDPSWSDTGGGIWTEAELCIGIVSACLPTLRPMIVYVFQGVSGKTFKMRSKQSSYEGTTVDGGNLSQMTTGKSYEAKGGSFGVMEYEMQRPIESV